MTYPGQLTGNLGRDPQIRYFENGTQVADFSLAVKQFKKDAPARWVKVTAWGKTAEFIADYLKKGTKVVAFGRVEAPEIYTKKTGEQAVIEKFTASDIEFTGSKPKELDCEDGFCPVPTKQADPVASTPKTDVFPPVGGDDIPF